MPYIPFTEEQKQTANNVELAEFLRMRGEKLERAGREYKLIYTELYNSAPDGTVGRRYNISI